MWEHPEPGYAYLRIRGHLATVVDVGGRCWRWEAYLSSHTPYYDRHGWWGIEETEEAAKGRALAFLGRY